MDSYSWVSAGGASAAAEGETFLTAHSRCRDVGFDGRQTVDPSRVLIVDTDVSRCSEIAVLVHSVGRFETRRAHFAEIALLLAGDFLPGFVLISTELADLSSYQLASAVHQLPGLFESRLIALASDIAVADRRAAFEAGFEQYLALPPEQGALERVLLYKSHRGLERRWRRPRRQ